MHITIIDTSLSFLIYIFLVDITVIEGYLTMQVHRLRSSLLKQSPIIRKLKPLFLSMAAKYFNDNTIDEYINYLEVSKGRLDRYWIGKLREVDKPSAKALITQLISENELGYNAATGPAKKGTLLEYVQFQKKKYPDKVHFRLIESRSGSHIYLASYHFSGNFDQVR